MEWKCVVKVRRKCTQRRAVKVTSHCAACSTNMYTQHRQLRTTGQRGDIANLLGGILDLNEIFYRIFHRYMETARVNRDRLQRQLVTLTNLLAAVFDKHNQ
jgi:hypothetical protein